MFGLGRAPAPAPADAVPYLPSSPGQQSESAEIAELQQLFSSRGPYPPPRDSTIPKTTLAKLKVGEELLLHADEARQEKEDRRRVREAQMSERLARAQTRREESKQRTERCRAAREAERMRKLCVAEPFGDVTQHLSHLSKEVDLVCEGVEWLREYAQVQARPLSLIHI